MHGRYPPSRNTRLDFPACRGYGFDAAEYTAFANEGIICIPIIESGEAVERSTRSKLLTVSTESALGSWIFLSHSADSSNLTILSTWRQ